jgi:hypothetical protein
MISSQKTAMMLDLSLSRLKLAQSWIGHDLDSRSTISSGFLYAKTGSGACMACACSYQLSSVFGFHGRRTARRGQRINRPLYLKR